MYVVDAKHMEETVNPLDPMIGSLGALIRIATTIWVI